MKGMHGVSRVAARGDRRANRCATWIDSKPLRQVTMTMLETYESTLAVRVTLALVFFGALLAYDLFRHGRASPRLREYSVLLLAMCIAVAYGVGHDHITATISPAYFLIGKGLADDPRPFRWAVTVLGIHATYGIGLLAGALLLIANNPSPKRPQLPYRHLIRLCFLPLALAVLFAALGGLVFAIEAFGLRRAAIELVGGADATRFAVTWGMHCGSYAGGTLGAILAIALVIRSRRRDFTRPPVVTQQGVAARQVTDSNSNSVNLVY